MEAEEYTVMNNPEFKDEVNLFQDKAELIQQERQRTYP